MKVKAKAQYLFCLVHQKNMHRIRNHLNKHGDYLMSANLLETKLPQEFEQFDNLPNAGYVRQDVVILLLGISRSTLWRGIKNHTFPAPINLTKRTIAWNVGLLRSHLAEKEGAK